MRDVLVEICVDSLVLARAAAANGADRIELCGPLDGGGITPSAGLAAAARRSIELPIRMLVRARTGDFTVSEAEFEVMRLDVMYGKTLGLDGVVIGILNEDRTVDVRRTAELVTLARPLEVTFHRAFDVVRDWEEGLEDVIESGCDRILTSGGAVDVLDGVGVVDGLRRKAGGRIGFVVCGGVTGLNAREALERSGCSEIHAALRKSAAAGLEEFEGAVRELKRAVSG